jgi:hypothetical protein
LFAAVTIDVLANDSETGGTIDTTSVQQHVGDGVRATPKASRRSFSNERVSIRSDGSMGRARGYLCQPI